jgi:hypothetical protein
MQAKGEALSLLANIVMAWNTGQKQAALDHITGARVAPQPYRQN